MVDDAWWLGSINVLTPVSQEYVGLGLRLKRVPKNRFGVLADSGDGGAQWSGQGFDRTHNATHAGGIDRNTTMRSPKLCTRKKNKLERGSRMVLVHCVPRAQ